MILLSRRSLLAIAAVVDIALHARPLPVAAKHLATRHNLPPRHLETVLQALVRPEFSRACAGPRGGYELARERRRITAGDIVRAAMNVDWRGRCRRFRNPRWWMTSSGPWSPRPARRS